MLNKGQQRREEREELIAWILFRWWCDKEFFITTGRQFSIVLTQAGYSPFASSTGSWVSKDWFSVLCLPPPRRSERDPLCGRASAWPFARSPDAGLFDVSFTMLSAADDLLSSLWLRSWSTVSSWIGSAAAPDLAVEFPDACPPRLSRRPPRFPPRRGLLLGDFGAWACLLEVPWSPFSSLLTLGWAFISFDWLERWSSLGNDSLLLPLSPWPLFDLPWPLAPRPRPLVDCASLCWSPKLAFALRSVSETR